MTEKQKVNSSDDCEWCIVLAKACKTKDKEIKRLHNKISALIKSKARMRQFYEERHKERLDALTRVKK